MNRIQKKLTPYQKLEQELRESAEETPAPRKSRLIQKLEKNKNQFRRDRRSGAYGPGRAAYDPTDDDLAPETLIHEDGARSPLEAGDDVPLDETYQIVSGNQIGAGYGLDEAELAEVDPLDRRP